MSQQIELACLAADRGDFDSALALAGQVAIDRTEFAACRALVASVYRQLGCHRRAAPYDAEGMSEGPNDPLGRAMAALGAVADLVGTGDLEGGRQALRTADAAVGRVPADHWARRWFDPWLTRAWVSAEVHLLADEPEAAVADLEPFAQLRPRSVPHTRWPYERAKTWLFLGVAQRCAGDTEAARENVARATRTAAQARLLPLLVPAWEQLHALDPQQAEQWAPLVQRARAVLARHAPPS